MKRILTGDRPTGPLHLGHYVGSLQNRIKLQNEDYEMFNIIADFQVLTDRMETDEVEENIRELVLDYLSVGLDPKKTNIFIQSKVPQLSELFVYISMLVTVSRAQQNPTIKEEVQATAGGKMSLGMLNMPVSQAADILAFNADLIPVGEDQLPHIEQTRDVVKTFNNTFGEVFKMPKALISKSPRLMGLDAENKMSKSRNNAVFLSDSKDEVIKKIKKAVTDSKKDIVYDKDKRLALANLLMMYHLFSGKDIKDIEKKYEGLGYKEFKEGLSDVINKFLDPIREKRKEFEKDEKYISQILKEGTEKASEEAEKTLKEVRKAMKYDYKKLGF